MGSITLNSNVAALSAQRQLGRSTALLRDTFTRLSSGLRINRAVDDASGLAIASGLNADARVFNQGVRNLNDGISLLNIADGALAEVSQITIRLAELSSQSANGVLAGAQRRALDLEASALIDEYNRIIETTEFNGKAVFDAVDSEVSLQAGYSSLVGNIGERLRGLTGDGTFQAAVNFGVPTGAATFVEPADFNGDGKIDLAVGTNFPGNPFNIVLGNGDGTFLAPTSYIVTAGRPQRGSAVDLNSDGILDIVTNDRSGGGIAGILIGNGDGTFKFHNGFNFGAPGGSILPGDFNGDGKADLAALRDTHLLIALGNGNGTFSHAGSYGEFSISSTGYQQLFTVRDLNQDGKLDLVVADDGFMTDHIEVLLGNGDGTFLSARSYSAGSNPSGIHLEDFTGDGNLDAVTFGAIGPTLLVGNTDGSFRAPTVINASLINSATSTDVNGDGTVDLLVTEAGNDIVQLFLSNGDGTFFAPVSYAVADGPGYATFADVNGDGAEDIVATNFNSGSVSVLLGNTNSTLRVEHLDLRTREGALEAIDTVTSLRERITAERGQLGAFWSRLEVAVSNLTQASTQFVASASQIMDADFAAESANLVRANILQQAGAAVLAQANRQPELALQLLSG